MTLTIDDITHISTLARLSLSDEEKARYAQELSAVLEYIEMLNDVDTEGVPETCQVTGLEDVTREDVVHTTSDADREALLIGFPHRVGNVLQVQAVFSEDDE